MVYYSLHRFYQNHRRYVKSRSNAQKELQTFMKAEELESCAPIIRVRDLHEHQHFAVAKDPVTG